MKESVVVVSFINVRNYLGGYITLDELKERRFTVEHEFKKEEDALRRSPPNDRAASE